MGYSGQMRQWDAEKVITNVVTSILSNRKADHYLIRCDMRKTPYLHENQHGKFFFRVRLPAPISRLSGRVELRIPLHTDSRKKAIKAVAAAHLAYHQFLDKAKMIDHLNEAEIDKKIAELRLDIRQKIARLTSDSLFVVHGNQLKVAWEYLEAHLSDELLSSYGLGRDDKNVIYQRVLTELVHFSGEDHSKIDHTDMLPIERELLLQKFRIMVPSVTQKHIEAVAASKKPASNHVSAPILNDHSVTFAELDKQEQDISSREYATGVEYARYAKVLDALADNRPVGQLTLDDFNRIHQDVFSLKLRVSQSVIPGVTGRKDVLTTNPDNTLNSETASNYSTRLNTLHDLAFKSRLTCIDPSIVTRQSLSIIRKKAKKYTSIEDSEAAEKAFTPEDLSKIFSGYLFNKTEPATTREVYPFHYWLPLLALYGGARVNELAQLNTDDVVLEGMIPNYKVEADDPAKVNEPRSLKNVSSKRRVPIHQHLLDLGFAEYVKERKRKKCKKLFDGLKYSRKNKWGADATQFFTRLDGKSGGYFKKVGVHLNGLDGKVFHSFRHLFISKLRNEVLLNTANPGYVIESITGHERVSVTEADRYGNGIELDRKLQFINQVKFEIDVISYVDFKKKFSGRLV